MLTSIDDHSRFVVVAAVLVVPSGRAVADAFLKAIRIYGVPAEVLTDNGKQFTGRFTKPRPAEVLFERVCRENGITQKLTKPYSPTTTGKIERWHQTLRRELLDASEPFVDLPAAHEATPDPAPGAEAGAGGFDVTAGMVLPSSAGAVEFDTVIAASGQLTVLSAVQRIRMGAERRGQRAHVWADEHSVHVLIDRPHATAAGPRPLVEDYRRPWEKPVTEPRRLKRPDSAGVSQPPHDHRPPGRTRLDQPANQQPAMRSAKPSNATSPSNSTATTQVKYEAKRHDRLKRRWRIPGLMAVDSSRRNARRG